MRIYVPLQPMHVGVAARQDRRPRRPAESLGRIAVVEANPGLGEKVKVGGVHFALAVRSDGIRSTLVKQEEQNVRGSFADRGVVLAACLARDKRRGADAGEKCSAIHGATPDEESDNSIVARSFAVERPGEPSWNEAVE